MESTIKTHNQNHEINCCYYVIAENVNFRAVTYGTFFPV